MIDRESLGLEPKKIFGPMLHAHIVFEVARLRKVCEHTDSDEVTINNLCKEKFKEMEKKVDDCKTDDDYVKLCQEWGLKV